MTSIRTLLLLTILLTLWVGCSEDPTSVGVGLLPTGDLPVFHVDTLPGVNLVSPARAIPLTARIDGDVPQWYPQHLFVGGLQTLVSGAYLRFESIPDSLVGVTVDGADLLLMPTTAVGDTTLSAVFTMHRPLKRWFGDSLSADSLRLQPGVYVESASLPPGVGAGSTDSGAVVVPLDPTFVSQWFATNVDTGVTNLGVYLRGTANGVIRGFGSAIHPTAAARPRVRVAYQKNGLPGTIVMNASVSRFLADLPSSDLVLDPTRLYVQSGVSYRQTATFDLTALPRPSSVNDCLVELTLDSAASDLRGGPDSLVAFYVENNNVILKGSAVPSEVVSVGGRRVHTFRIPLYAQQWLRTGVAPRIVLAGFSESTTFSRYVFYGPSAAPNLRPRIIVTYSKAVASWGRRS
jgi:hypothetical protein